MIYFNFRLANPFSVREDEYINKLSNYGRIRWTKNKSWEFEFHKSSGMIINFGIDLSFKRCHAGVCVWFGLLGYWVSFEIYDNRHWNYKDNCWENVEDME